MKEIIFETRELYLAAALELQGMFVTDITVIGSSGTFQITCPDGTDTDALESDYLNNRLGAPVLALKEKVKELRFRLNKTLEMKSRT